MASNTNEHGKGFDFSAYATRNASGAVDVQATHLKFTKDLADYIAMEKTDNEVIARAVDQAFRANKTSSLGMNAVLHYAMQNLESSTENFNVVRERVASYIRSNTRTFKVSKGKGGGVQYLSPEESTPSIAVESGTSRTRTSQPGSMRPRQSQHG